MTTLKDAYAAGYRLTYLQATFTAQAIAVMFGRSLPSYPVLVRG